MNPAFAYIYDEILSDRRLERDVSLLETELARRGIEGRIVRLAMFRQPKDVLSDLCKTPVKNIIFIGNDQTLQKMIWFLPDLNFTIGYIALAQPSSMASILGIPFGVSGVDTIAARLVDLIDIGKINDRYFLSEVIVPETHAALSIENQYRLSPAAGGAIAIRNLAGTVDQPNKCAHPIDGKLEGVIQARVKESKNAFWKKGVLSESRVYFEHGTIHSEKPIEIFVDGQSMRGTDFSLSILPKKLRMITGKLKAWEPLVKPSTF